MFIAALSTIAEIWKRPECPSVGGWIRKWWHMYAVDYYSITLSFMQKCFTVGALTVRLKKSLGTYARIEWM